MYSGLALSTPSNRIAMTFTLLLAGCMLSGCQTNVGIQSEATPYKLNQQYDSANRNPRIRLLVIHYTAIDWEKSLRALTQKSDRPVSAHYLIPESFDASYPAQQPLQVYQLVDEQQRAWHAGASRWEDRVNLNDQSIGIELVNQGWCYYRPALSQTMPLVAPQAPPQELCISPDFDPAQMQLLAQLAKDILARNPEISPTRVVGHSDIVPARKQDPGARFPWQWLAKQGIGAWYDGDTLKKYWQGLTKVPAVLTVQMALKQYGYGIELTGQHDLQSRQYIMAFQRHFLPEQVTGDIDLKTVAVLWALLEKYFPASFSAEPQLQLPLIATAATESNNASSVNEVK